MENRNKYRKRKLNAKGKRKRRRRIIKRILRIIIIALPILLVLMIGSCTKRFISEKDDKKELSEKASEATVMSSGDVILHEPFLISDSYLKEDGNYNYDPIFTYVKELHSAADLSVVNLENTISDGEYTAYPLFKGPSAIAASLSNNGVDLCLLANNHIYDNYTEGLTMTQQSLEENSLLYTGVSKSTTDNKYQIIELHGIKIGILNYTFETDTSSTGQHTINSLEVKEADLDLINTFEYNNLDPFYEEISTSLLEMSESNVDYTIAYIHWGTEYKLIENDHQQKIAQKLCDLGIDALIGGHPHVIQPIDILTAESGEHQMLCMYSIGNHMSNQYRERIESLPEGHTEDGLMVQLKIDKDENGNVSLKDVIFIPTWNYRTPGVSDDENPEFFILPLNDIENLKVEVKENNNLDVETQMSESLERTNIIISDGVDKVQQALPILAKKGA